MFEFDVGSFCQKEQPGNARLEENLDVARELASKKNEG
jgi:hypothetical protein